MRTFRFLHVAILSLLVGSTAVLYAQDQKQEDNHPAQEEAKPQPKPDMAHPEDAKPGRPEAAAPAKPEDRRAQEQAAPDRDHPEARPEEHPQGHPEQAHNMQGHGGRIPDKDFHAHFGRDHHFRAQGVIVAGQPQFQYGGYSFQMVDAWPAGWAYTDDCYVDYIDGEYFLIDLMHPGMRLALFVVM